MSLSWDLVLYMPSYCVTQNQIKYDPKKNINTNTRHLFLGCGCFCLGGVKSEKLYNKTVLH